MGQSSILDEMLRDPVLCQSCADDHSCREFMGATALLFLEDKRKQLELFPCTLNGHRVLRVRIQLCLSFCLIPLIHLFHTVVTCHIWLLKHKLKILSTIQTSVPHSHWSHAHVSVATCCCDLQEHH